MIKVIKPFLPVMLDFVHIIKSNGSMMTFFIHPAYAVIAEKGTS